MHTDQNYIAMVALHSLGLQEAYQRPSLASVFIRVNPWLQNTRSAIRPLVFRSAWATDEA